MTISKFWKIISEAARTFSMTTVHKAAEISLTTKSISDVTGGMLNVQMMEQLGRNGITSLLIPLKVASEINACDHQ